MCDSLLGSSSEVWRLLPPHIRGQDAVACGAAALVERLATCYSVRRCSFHWVALALFLGRFAQITETEDRKSAWNILMWNVTTRMRNLRTHELRPLPKKRLTFLGHPLGLEGSAAEGAASLLVYADSASYYEKPNVAPFLHQLRCYANVRGMRFVADQRGPRVKHRQLGTLDVSIQQEFWLSAREEEGSGVHDDGYARSRKTQLDSLATDLCRREGPSERLAEVVDFEEHLAINYAHVLNFDRIWAIEEELRMLEPGAMLVYFDVDVTIRPDSYHQSLVKLLLAQQPSLEQPPHIFLADTWAGTECVNSGFVAFRNTDVARLFLQLWKEKMWWGAGWDQAALAETTLELLGAEVSKMTNGKKSYSHECLESFFPIADGVYTYQRYCDCWQAALEKLVGPYRQRKSRLVSFVDPERVEINFVPNNLFFDHSFMLSGMHLIPLQGRPFLTPFVVHWAGLVPHRLDLLEDYMRTRFQFGLWDCPAQKGQAQLGTAPPLGTRARHLRCCQKLRARANKSQWPWTQQDGPEGWVAQVHYWGCSDWRAVTDDDCTELLGEKIVYTM